MPLEIRNINKSFGKQQVLHDVSLSIQPGEVIGLLGPNGAGKSTLMKIVLGLWHADSGTVEAPVTHGYLPEQNPLYDDMYVREYLRYMARLTEGAPTTAEYIEQLIERVGLTPEAHKRLGQLSKGYRQRVGLAAALIGEPQLIILDEPTTGLDPNQLDEIRTLIRSLTQLSEKGHQRIVILSTHILQEVREMCTRVVILDHGHIKADQPINQIDNLEEFFRNATR